MSPFDLSFVWCCYLSALSQTVVLSVLLSRFCFGFTFVVLFFSDIVVFSFV